MTDSDSLKLLAQKIKQDEAEIVVEEVPMVGEKPNVKFDGGGGSITEKLPENKEKTMMRNAVTEEYQDFLMDIHQVTEEKETFSGEWFWHMGRVCTEHDVYGERTQEEIKTIVDEMTDDFSASHIRSDIHYVYELFDDVDRIPEGASQIKFSRLCKNADTADEVVNAIEAVDTYTKRDVRAFREAKEAGADGVEDVGDVVERVCDGLSKDKQAEVVERVAKMLGVGTPSEEEAKKVV